MPLPANNFAHTLIRAERRLFIYSFCLICKEGKIVSEIDGSLKDWEDGHLCRKKPVPVADGPTG